jgi:hypothetical protein
MGGIARSYRASVEITVPTEITDISWNDER